MLLPFGLKIARFCLSLSGKGNVVIHVPPWGALLRALNLILSRITRLLGDVTYFWSYIGSIRVASLVLRWLYLVGRIFLPR